MGALCTLCYEDINDKCECKIPDVYKVHVDTADVVIVVPDKE